MKTTARILLFLLVVAICAASGSYAADTEHHRIIASNESSADELEKGDAAELDQGEANLLLSKIKSLGGNYRATAEDAAELTGATLKFIQVVNGYSKQVKASEPGTTIPAPHEELKDYCGTLETFFRKYNVTAEDALEVGRVLTNVTMSVKKVTDFIKKSDAPSGEGTPKATVSKEDINAIFIRLKEFARKHNIMACDLVPVINSVADIGLTLMQNKVSAEQMQKSGGRWRKRLYDNGVSKEQADALYDSLVAFTRKYNIGLLEIVRLNKDIHKILKGNPAEQEK